MEECIDISDDEVEVIGQFITCEPIVVDLTDSDTPVKHTGEPQQPQEDLHEQEQLHREDQHREEQRQEYQQQQERLHQEELYRQEQRQREAQNQQEQRKREYQQFLERRQQENQRLQKQQQQENQRLFERRQQEYQRLQKQQQQQVNQHQLERREQENRYIQKQQHQPEQPQNGNQDQPEQQHLNPQADTVVEQPAQLSDRELMLEKKELGNKRYRANQLNEAVRLYREAGDLARKLDDKEFMAILHFNLAMTYSRLGSYTQAADECAAAVKIDNNYMKAHCKRAEIYMSQGKYDEAVICYEYICELDSTKKDEAMKRIAYAREMSKRSRKLDRHEILGLQPNFTIEDLRKNYRKKARTHHPDRHSDADVVSRRIQERIFKETSEAYAFFQKRYGFH